MGRSSQEPIYHLKVLGYIMPILLPRAKALELELTIVIIYNRHQKIIYVCLCAITLRLVEQ